MVLITKSFILLSSTSLHNLFSTLSKLTLIANDKNNSTSIVRLQFQRAFRQINRVVTNKSKQKTEHQEESKEGCRTVKGEGVIPAKFSRGRMNGSFIRGAESGAVHIGRAPFCLLPTIHGSPVRRRIRNGWKKKDGYSNFPQRIADSFVVSSIPPKQSLFLFNHSGKGVHSRKNSSRIINNRREFEVT